jgi:hypothetical protein
MSKKRFHYKGFLGPHTLVDENGVPATREEEAEFELARAEGEWHGCWFLFGLWQASMFLALWFSRDARSVVIFWALMAMPLGAKFHAAFGTLRYWRSYYMRQCNVGESSGHSSLPRDEFYDRSDIC